MVYRSVHVWRYLWRDASNGFRIVHPFDFFRLLGVGLTDAAD